MIFALVDRFAANDGLEVAYDLGKGMRADGFFQAVRGTSVTALYNNKELWPLFGYEGSSYEFGGYLHRGFNDLSWLPDPPETASPKPE